MKQIFKFFIILFLTSMSIFSQESKIYQSSATMKTRLQHTKLDVKFDFQKEEMPAEAWITASPYFYSTDSLVLDAKGMLIHEVSINKKKLTYFHKENILTILLDKKYNRNENYTVYIKYTARPNEVKQKGSAAIKDAKGLYFINPRGEEQNKPTQIWTQGETESSSCWFPTIDKPNQKMSEEITITVPDKFVTLSNGSMLSSKKNTDGTRSDYWKFDKKHAPYLFFMGIGEYSIVQDKWKNIPVNYYVEKEYEPFAKGIFGETPNMINFFSDVLKYPFPWEKYHQIVGRDYVSGAMENTTAVIHAENANQKTGQLIDENKWEDVIAHELFHHWFGDLVTSESWSNLTVNESFANYSEYLWREHRYGKDHAEQLRNKDLDGYFRGNNFNKHLVRFDYGDKEDMFDSVSYNKGGYILHMLRKYLGDEAFFEGLKLYLTQNAYKSAEAHHLRLALEETSGKDLNWFFNQWYFSNGHPKLKIGYEYNDSIKKVKVIIQQTQENILFQFPFVIDVYENGKATRHNIWVPAQKEFSVELPYKIKPQLVNVNADQVLLCQIIDDKNLEQAIFQYNNTPEYLDRRLAIEKIAGYHTSKPEALETLLKACNDKYYELRIFAIGKLEIKHPNVKEKALKVIQNIVEKDEKTLVQAAALKSIIDSGTDLNPYKTIFINSSQSKSDAVKSTAILALYGIDKENTIKAVKNLNSSEITSESFKANIAEIIINEKIIDKLDLVAEEVPMFPFIRDSKLGKLYQNGFELIFSSDNLEATKKSVAMFSKIYPEAKQHGANEVVKQVLTKGLELKKQIPDSESKNKQIELIVKALEKMN